MRIRIVIAYFGKLPNYFQLWLDSCALNPKINWLLLTDDKSAYNYPKNLTVIYNDLESVINRIQGKYDFKVIINSPYDLCLFKPAFGEVFSDYLKDFDFWGYGDTDVIYGDLSTFITPEILLKYEKILCLGHLSLYKNTPEVNSRYKLPLHGEEVYKKAFAEGVVKKKCFDEWSIAHRTIVDIYLAYNLPFYVSPICAEFHTWYSNFRLVEFWYGKPYVDPIEEHVFLWDKGRLTRMYARDGKIYEQEYGYIHLQKRKMTVDPAVMSSGRFLIVPNSLIPAPDVIDIPTIQKYSRRPLIDRRYFRIRWGNLKVKIRLRLLR